MFWWNVKWCMSGCVGVCVFNLWCKVDVLTLNPLYEIFTCNMVGRELRQFTRSYPVKVSQCVCVLFVVKQ